MKNNQIKILSLIALLALTGCDKGPKLVEYKVTVKDYEGNVLPNVSIDLLTITESVAASGKHSKEKEVIATSKTNAQGEATFKALPGEYHFRNGKDMVNGLAIQDEVITTTEEGEFELVAWPFLDNSVEPTLGSLRSIGVTFHDFEVTLCDGETKWNLAEKLYDYKCVLVNIWASWCNPCMSEMGDIQQAWKRVNDRVAFIGLDCEETDSNSIINTIRTNKKLIFPMARDTVGVNEWVYAESIPTTFVIDRFGRVVKRVVGSQPSAASFIDMVAPYLGSDYNPYIK